MFKVDYFPEFRGSLFIEEEAMSRALSPGMPNHSVDEHLLRAHLRVNLPRAQWVLLRGVG